MFCAICKNDLIQCTCDDLQERLAGIRNVVASRWCISCNNHYAECKCNNPNWKLRMPNGEMRELPVAN